MAVGLEVLMKSFGVDPDEIKNQMGLAQQRLNDELTSIHAQLDRIEGNQKTILDQQREQGERLAEIEEREGIHA
jgi:hypothetical protein